MASSETEDRQSQVANHQAPDVNRKSKVLVVDDNVQNVELVEAYLTATGLYDVVSAYSGEEALQKVEADRPDIVLLAAMMPGISGFEVCGRLKADPRTRLVPVIIITSLEDYQNKITGLEAGAEDFLTKPIDKVELLARVRNLVRIKRLTDELQQSSQALRELERWRNDLTDMMVHDIRNVMAAVMGNVQLALEAPSLPEADRAGLQSALLGSRRILCMADDLLDISRMEAQRMPLRPRRMDLRLLLDQGWQAVATRAAQCQVQSRVDCGPEVPLVEADPYLLERVLGNLLDNAVRYSPAGGEVRVLARRGDQEGWVQVSVYNMGEPIAPEYHELIFEKFMQVEVKEAGYKSGRGLGLAFCKLAVEAHGGRIWVESPLAEEKGAGFHFTLPAFREAEAGLTQAD